MSSPLNPASYFLQLWQQTKALSDTEIACISGSRKLQPQIANALALNAAADVITALQKLLQQHSSSENDKQTCSFEIMQGIDDVFAEIHPRSLIDPKSRTTPSWLHDLHERRLVFGNYAKTKDLWLVPRGPLLRSARDEFASGGISRQDCFKALSAVPQHLQHDGKTIRVQHQHVGVDEELGVAPGKDVGNETIVFMPIAEQAQDLSIQMQAKDNRWLAEYALHADLDAAQIIFKALQHAGQCDIALASELMVSSTHADNLAALLQSKPGIRPRLVVAGSGASALRNETGQAWNEGRVFNQNGAPLWQQSKIWIAVTKAPRTHELGLCEITDQRTVIEDNANSDTLTIADVDGLGRCAVLICQDIKGAPFAFDFVLHYQPDWIFIPLLDRGVHKGGWANQQAFALSEIANTRFLFVTSTSLGNKPGEKVYCAMAVGPKTGQDGEVNRARQLAEAANGYAKMTWREGSWEQTKMT